MFICSASFSAGEGNYGVVYKGRSKKTGQIGAIKIMDAILDKEEDIKSELNVFLNYSSHENIVDCFGIYLKTQERTDDQLWIVMEVRKPNCSCQNMYSQDLAITYYQLFV